MGQDGIKERQSIEERSRVRRWLEGLVEDGQIDGWEDGWEDG
jgi:hypothetical protein